MMQVGTRLGPYEVLEPLGAGGMGEVYRALDTRLDRVVAIKLLAATPDCWPQGHERVLREARATSSLAHPHICALYDVGNHAGVDYLVMEYLEGETLEARLLTGQLPFDEAIRIAIQIASAMGHAHDRGIVHRDLKPSNIVLTASGVKLVDFGLAKLTDAAQGDGRAVGTVSLAAEHRVVGSLCYMAPEQVEAGPIDARTDIFALGAVLHEMLCGRRAFDGPSHSSIVAAILGVDPPPPSSTQPALRGHPQIDHLVARCLAKRPDERWQSARDVAAELEWIERASEPGVGGRRVGSRVKTAGVTRRLGVALVFTAIAMLAVSWWLARSKSAAPPVGPIRFSIGPPPGAAFSRSGGFMAVSPDGRLIAFVATEENGSAARLWIRPLDRETAYPLPGTEGANQPFWSADSHAVAFLANDRLKRIDVNGDAPTTICDAPLALAGTWSDDGLIVFTHMAQGLDQVSANGGTPTPATTLDASRQETTHGWPVFLPDRRHLLFTISGARAAFTGLFVGEVGSAERTRLTDAYSSAAFVEPGYVLYTRGGLLVAQRFDASRRQAIGDPVPLVEGVAHNMLTGRSTFSTSTTGILAYRSVVHSQLRFVDRHGASAGSLGEPAVYLDPAISPDGARVAVARVDPTTGSSSIWIFDAARGVSSRVTESPSDDTAPVWSPDGRTLAYEAHRNDTLSVCVKGPNPGDPEQVFYSSPYYMGPTDWSRDGRIILCEAFEPARPGRVWVFALPRAGTASRPEPWEPGQQGRLSPDGRWVAYVSPESGQNEVYVKPMAGPAKWRVSPAGGIEPRWRGDGRELFYLAPGGTMMAVSVRLGDEPRIDSPQRLFATRLSGNSARLAGRNQYDVSSDGQKFLLNEPPAPSGITVVVNWPALLPH